MLLLSVLHNMMVVFTTSMVLTLNLCGGLKKEEVVLPGSPTQKARIIIMSKPYTKTGNFPII